MSEPSPPPSDEGVSEAEYLVRDLGGVHQVGREDEERHGDQDEVVEHLGGEYFHDDAHIHALGEEVGGGADEHADAYGHFHDEGDDEYRQGDDHLVAHARASLSAPSAFLGERHFTSLAALRQIVMSTKGTNPK